MSVGLIGTPATGILTAFNRLEFRFAKGTGDLWMQLKIIDQDSNTIVETKATPFKADATQTIDVSPYLQTYLQQEGWLSDYTGNNKLPAVGNGFAEIDLSFTLEYKTNITASYTSIGSTYDFAPAIRNIEDEFQGLKVLNPDTNLSEFNSEEGTSIKGKFLTKLSTRRIYWFAPDVADPSNTGDVLIFQQQNAYALEDAFTAILLRASLIRNGAVAVTITNVPTTPFARAYFPTWLAQRIFEYDELLIEIEDTTNSVTILSQSFKPEKLCFPFTVVKYINAFGVFETFAFEGRNPRSNDFDKGDEYETYPDISSSLGTGRVLTSRQFPAIEVEKDQLTLEEAKAIEDLFTSPVVMLYVGGLIADESTVDWVECKVEGGSVQSYDEFNSKHRVSATLRLNERLTLRN